MSKDMPSVVLMHLDLGIGGAEQLVVSIAKSLLELGYDVDIMTTHHDVSHAFEETKPQGILGKSITVYGDWIPRHLFNRFTALLAIIRMIFLAFIVILLKPDADLIIIDGVSAPIPILKCFGFRVLFYCHFPDLLLCTERKGNLKQLYRNVVDKIEELTTSQADQILVNSNFTREVFAQTFPKLFARKKPLILYPVVPKLCEFDFVSYRTEHLQYTKGYNTIFVSVNRYERKKKIEVAIEALKRLFEKHPASDLEGPVLLVVAGGYDSRVEENVQYFEELRQICEREGLRYQFVSELGREEDTQLADKCVQVIFRRSIPTQERVALFRISTALLYTPDREHFGIVPIEAMSAGLPVIAVNSGGPTETVVDNETGYLCEQNSNEFAERMFLLATKTRSSQGSGVNRMKAKAVQWVEAKFSEQAMRNQLRENLTQLLMN